MCSYHNIASTSLESPQTEGCSSAAAVLGIANVIYADSAAFFADFAAVIYCGISPAVFYGQIVSARTINIPVKPKRVESFREKPRK